MIIYFKKVKTKKKKHTQFCLRQFHQHPCMLYKKYEPYQYIPVLPIHLILIMLEKKERKKMEKIL